MRRFVVLLRRLPWLLCIASLTGVSFLAFQHYTYRTAVTDRQKAQLLEISRQAAQDIDRVALEVKRGADAIAASLSTRPTDDSVRRQAEKQLEQLIAAHPSFFGGTVTYRPYGLQKTRRLYSAYYLKKDGRLAFTQLDRTYDYSNGNYAWYTAAMKQGSRWSEPYFDEAAKTLMTTYSSVFYQVDAGTGAKTPLGVVTIDVSLDEVKNIMESLSLGVGGYGALVSNDGVYLYHPNGEYVAAGKTLMDVARESKDADRLYLGEMLREKNLDSGIRDHVSVTTGLASWLAYEPVPSSHWLLLCTFIRDDVAVDNDKLRRQLLLITGLGALCLITLAFQVLRAHANGAVRIWLQIAITTLVLAAGIGLIWYLALLYDSEVIKGTPVVHRAEINDLAEKLDADARKRNAVPPIYLPTGVLIESLRFADGNDVIISGQAWQRIDAGMPAGIVPGINLLSAEDVKTMEIYRHTSATRTLVRWQFQGRVRQNLRHTRYPIERESLAFSLVARDLTRQVILVPDLSSYTLNNPAALPGLAEGLTLPGWEIEKSFFDLSKWIGGRSLGMDAQTGIGDNLPVLRFNVVVKKHFLDSFVSNQFPLIVVSIMLFALLVTTTCDEKLMDKMKTTAGMALSMSSALIFIVVFSHIGIRRIVVSDDIFYLEYFYFVVYFAILTVALVSIAHAFSGRREVLYFKDIHIVRLLYWPVMFGTLFAITLRVFY